MRHSKVNPYQCPQCDYKSSRKWNMKLHLSRVHGLAPFLPEHSRSDWVFAQLHDMAKKYAEADIAGNKELREKAWRSMVALYGYNRGMFPIERIVTEIKKKREELERKAKAQH